MARSRVRSGGGGGPEDSFDADETPVKVRKVQPGCPKVTLPGGKTIRAKYFHFSRPPSLAGKS